MPALSKKGKSRHGAFVLFGGVFCVFGGCFCAFFSSSSFFAFQRDFFVQLDLGEWEFRPLEKGEPDLATTV